MDASEIISCKRMNISYLFYSQLIYHDKIYYNDTYFFIEIFIRIRLYKNTQNYSRFKLFLFIA